MTYKVNKMPDTNFYFNLWLISQLDLLRGTEIQGEFINLWSHGGLCAPTIETLLFTLKCDQGFSKRYGRGRKVFQTVFWLMILKVFLMTTYFRMETLWPHYNDDFMDFLLVNEFFVMEWIEQIYLNINHQSRLYMQRVFQVCIIHSYRRSRSSVEVRYSSEAW